MRSRRRVSLSMERLVPHDGDTGCVDTYTRHINIVVNRFLCSLCVTVLPWRCAVMLGTANLLIFVGVERNVSCHSKA